MSAADHEAIAVLVDLFVQALDVRADLSFERHPEHPPSSADR